MANIQTFPQSLYPIKGDVVSQDGNPSVTVVAIQNEPWATDTPQPGQVPVQGSDGVWHPEDPVVSGTDAPGTPSTANPVQVAGIDGVVVREMLTDPQGAVVVSASAGLGEQMQILIQEIRALKTAIIALDNVLIPQDFDAADFSDQTTGSVLP